MVQPSPRRSMRAPNVNGNSACRRLLLPPDEIHNIPIDRVKLRLFLRLGKEVYSKTAADFLKYRFPKTSLHASRDHALNAAAPLLNKAEFMEHPTHDSIPQFGNAAANFLDGKPWREASGIIDFNSIAEDGYAQWSSALGVIGMD
jgi:hypothetical protein